MSESDRDGAASDPDGTRPSTAAGVPSTEGPPPAAGVDAAGGGRAAFVRALRVRRNAAWGVGVGVLVALVTFLVFVGIPQTIRSPLWYVGLAFVLAVSVAGLVAAALTLVRAVRLSRSL